MRKILLLIVVLGLLCSTFTGCAGPQSPSGSNTGSTETAPQKKSITISYMASQDWVQKAEQDVGAKFESETGIKVDYQIVPADQYPTLLKTKLNAGECTDLFGNQSGKFDIVSLLDIEKNGVDLSNEEWAKRFDPLAAEQLSVNGKLYGMTLADVSAVWGICYNKNIFNDLGLKIPTTYNEFKDVCQKILNAGIIPIYECVSDGWHHVLWFPELGGRYEELNPGLADKLNSNETTFEQNETMLEALTQLNDLIDLGYFGKNYMSNTYADTEKNMASGEYAMTVYNQGLPQQIENAYPDVKADTFGFFVIPLVDNQILNVNPAGPSIFVYSGSKNIDAAKQYLAYIAKPENLQYILDNTPKFNSLPFSGLNDKYSDEIRNFYNAYPKHGTVYQTQIKYLNPQWLEIGKDLSAMFTDAMQPIDVLKSIDKRRSDAAKAAKDPNWVN
ncbi:MAG: extracellular solute-binding protein [Bacillota bacterium]|nr:extracellular solute-binding protein [Bacillota bacterium]